MNKHLSPQVEVVLFSVFQISFKIAGKDVYWQLTLQCIGCSLFSVLWYGFMNKQTCPFFFKKPQNTFSPYHDNGHRAWNLEIISRGISSIMIHQIFLLLCDWPKCIMLTYIPLLKLGDTRDYHPSHTHQFSNLTFATISLQVKFGYRWLLQKKGNTCLFIKLYGRNLVRKYPMKKQ